MNNFKKHTENELAALRVIAGRKYFNSQTFKAYKNFGENN